MDRNQRTTTKASAELSVSENARELAFSVLEEYRTSSQFAVRILDQRLGESELSDADRRLTTELVAGTVRRRLTLDALIEPHVSRPRRRVEHPLWTLLQLGTYQLVFLHSIPNHAAVDETVELAKRMGRPRWSGLLNAALRSVSCVLGDSETDQPAANAVPLADGKYRVLERPVFPEPQTDPAGYLSAAFSFPSWCCNRWLPRMGWQNALRTAFWFNEPHGITLRINPLRAKQDDVVRELSAAGVELVAGEESDFVHLSKTTNVTRLPGFSEGHWTPQDESAIEVSRLLAPRPGDTVLDLCAAPGTKTTHMAEMMHNTGRIIATDTKADRLKQVSENARRLGLTIIEPQPISPDLHDIPVGPFDCVLVDAPCSNTGVLGKRPEARWRIQPRDIEELADLQKRLLSVAADLVKPRGRLVYSTCSMEPEENERVVATILGNRFDLQLEEQHASLPGQPADGGFRAEFRRVETARDS